VIAAVVAPATFALSQWALGPHAMSFGDPGVPRAVFGAWAYLTLMSAIAMGVATMLRSTAISLGVLIPLLFLNSQGLGNVPKIRTIAQFLPDQAGFMMTQVVRPEPSFISYRDYTAWTGLAILIVWTTAALIGGYLTLHRRDTT
jgi:ABC-2 type transport system permease protein